MAEEKKYKSPEELGLAVGEKIEELFGSFFTEPESPQEAPARPPAEQKPAEPAVVPPPRPPTPAPPVVSRPAAPAASSRKARSFEELIDRIEALILNLEWEAKQDTIHEAALRFREAEQFFPEEGHGRTIAGMNYRVLRRFDNAEVAPHPLLVKLLQESTEALRVMHARGKSAPEKTLMASIVKTYNQIATTLKSAAPSTQPAQLGEGGQYVSLVGQVGATVQGIEEVGQRLSRLVARLKQRGDKPDEEITRRLGALDALLAERVSRLAAVHRQLSGVTPPDAPVSRAAGEPKSGSEGLLMVEWGAVPLAIPSSFILALYPLPKAQAQQLLGKPAVSLGNRQVPRLPLKRPQGAPQQEAVLPSWLIHLTSGGKEYFLLGDRALGYRRSPKGMDLARESKVKIGNTSYTILNQAAFR